MAKCEQQGFSGVTGAHFAALLKKGEAMGVPISGNSGQATREGVTLTWSYDETANTLNIQCTDAPFFVPCAAVNARIRSMIESILAGVEHA